MSSARPTMDAFPGLGCLVIVAVCLLSIGAIFRVAVSINRAHERAAEEKRQREQTPESATPAFWR